MPQVSSNHQFTIKQLSSEHINSIDIVYHDDDTDDE